MNNIFIFPFIAHRGLHDNISIPENSLLSFAKAQQMGYAIELDIQLSLDGIPMVFHDRSLKRMTGVRGDITKTSSKELNNLRLLSTSQAIPTLQESLDLVAGKVPLLIDIKIETLSSSKMENIIKILENYKGDYLIQSLNVLILRWLWKNYPSIRRGIIISKVGRLSQYTFSSLIKKLALKFVNPIKMCNADFISYEKTLLPNKNSRKYLQNGRPIFAWTIKNEEEYKWLKPYCSNIIFENFKPKIN